MGTTLTKACLVEKLFRSGKMSRAEARTVVDSFFKIITTRLINGEMLKISSFGNFVLRDKKARPGRNPKTGKDAIISARRVVTFRAGQKLKTRVAHYKGELTKDEVQV